MAGIYDFLDKRAAALGNGGRLLLWSLRMGGLAVAGEAAPASLLDATYAALGLAEALPAIHMASALLDKAVPPLSLDPIASPAITDDEALLLALWRDEAEGQGDPALADALVGPAAAPPLRKAIWNHAERLGRAGYAIAVPDGPAEEK